MRHYNMP